METKFVERHVSPSLGDFALQERGKLLEEVTRLRRVLQSAEVLRPKLLLQYGAVPEYVLDFCNKARAALAERTA